MEHFLAQKERKESGYDHIPENKDAGLILIGVVMCVPLFMLFPKAMDFIFKILTFIVTLPFKLLVVLI
jgi:hypothetical protein